MAGETLSEQVAAFRRALDELWVECLRALLPAGFRIVEGPGPQPVGYIDPEAAFLLPVKDGAVLSAHHDVLIIRDPYGRFTQPLYTKPPDER